jgi:hypothetical protein
LWVLIVDTKDTLMQTCDVLNRALQTMTGYTAERWAIERPRQIKRCLFNIAALSSALHMSTDVPRWEAKGRGDINALAGR